MEQTIAVMCLLTAMFIGNSLEMNIIHSRKCILAYDDEGGYIYHDTRMTHEGAVAFCDDKHGRLPQPTDEKWTEILRYLRSKQRKSKHSDEGDWIGVTFKKNADLKIEATDSSNVELSAEQKDLIPIKNKHLFNELQVGQKLCVMYLPPEGDEPDWYFQLQGCGGTGVRPTGRAVCKCVFDVIEKDNTPIPKNSAEEKVRLPQSNAQTGSNDSATQLIPEGRAGRGPVPDVPDAVEEGGTTETVGGSSTSLAVIVGMLVVCCLIGTAYYVVKRQGWDVRRMISRRMPYNRPRTSLNGSGDLYLRGHEMSEVSSHSRPIHVYEEIIPRNRSGAFVAAGGHRTTILSSTSSVTMPHIPPPDPPIGYLPESMPEEFVERPNKSREDGYMQPSFRRNDTIPGDVRSPLPIEGNVFTFPVAKPIPKMNTLQVPGEKELKYASVETVQTLLDDENNDEEYLVDENDSGVNVSTESREESLVVELPEKSQKDSKNRNSIANSYVKVIGEPSHLPDMAGCDAISPVFPCNNDYENERFLTTVMKVPPVKPKRKTKNSPPRLEPQVPTSNDSVIYARIPSVSNEPEPVYSQVKRKEDRHQPTDRFSGAYTPMKSNTLRREEEQSPTFINIVPATTEENITSQKMNGTNSISTERTTRKKNFISSPSMISTTNKALENSSLVCYEIPPEYEDTP